MMTANEPDSDGKAQGCDGSVQSRGEVCSPAGCCPTAGIDVRDTGLIFRGSDAEPHMRNAYFPSVVQTHRGELVASMDIGAAMSSRDIRSYLRRSDDGGKTWSAPRRIFEPDESSHPVHTPCRMSAAADGRLIGFVALTDRSRADSPATNPENGGGSDMELALLSSEDDGATWSPPQKLDPPLDWKCFEICHAVMPVAADRWLLPIATRRDWNGGCVPGVKALVLVSEDQGRTWPSAVTVFDFWADETTSWEQKHTLLSDGRILAVCWPFNIRTRKDRLNHYAFSEDGGLSFGGALESPLCGQTCTAMALTGNHVLFVYRRLDKRGLWAHLAHIEGATWRPVTEVPLWGQDVEAIAGGLDSRMENLRALQFGYPQLIQLTDGDVFLVFWCVEDGLSVIRWFRLRVELPTSAQER